MAIPNLQNPFSSDSMNAALTMVFVTVNWLHDLLNLYGFDEASGNFQQVNFRSENSNTAGDRVMAYVQFGAQWCTTSPFDNCTNNANFQTPPDGQAPVGF